MKCDELKEIMMVNQVSGERTPSGTYKKAEVDAYIAELKARIHELESMPHTDNSAVIDALETENEALKKELAELREATRWRKCSEEMPNQGDDVLFTDSKYIYMGYWSSWETGDSDHSNEFECGWVESNGDEKDFDFKEITYWMPLPKAPEAK